MPESGYFAQKQRSPASLALVVLLHAALIAAVILIRSPAFQRFTNPPTVVTLIDDTPDPPPEHQPVRQPDQPQQHPQETIDHADPVVNMNPTGPVVDTSHQNTVIASNIVGDARVELPPPPPPPLPVRRAAQIDSASRLQPPYPPSEIRAGRDGRVQVRITIGPDGRVVDVVRVSATSDAFFQATRDQALRFWRFRPATVDGRPVEETRVMSVVFRLEDQA